MLVFEERRLAQRLTNVPLASRVVFALLCTQRVIDACRSRVKDTAQVGSFHSLQRDQDRIWLAVAQGPADRPDLERTLERVLSAITESEDEASEAELCTDSVASALAYAIRAWLSRDVQEAVWAARRSYEVADEMVLQLRHTGVADEVDEGAQVKHPTVQRELQWQEDDLRDLERAGNEPQLKVLTMLAQRNRERLTSSTR